MPTQVFRADAFEVLTACKGGADWVRRLVLGGAEVANRPNACSIDCSMERSAVEGSIERSIR